MQTFIHSSLLSVKYPVTEVRGNIHVYVLYKSFCKSIALEKQIHLSLENRSIVIKVTLELSWQNQGNFLSEKHDLK